MALVKIEFLIIGDEFPHQTISKMLNINPNIAYQKNDLFLGGGSEKIQMKRQESCWCLETDDTDTIDVQKEIYKIFNKLKDKTNLLNEISLKFSAKFKFVIVIYFRDNNPIITINSELVKFASEINAEFDFDTYV